MTNSEHEGSYSVSSPTPKMKTLIFLSVCFIHIHKDTHIHFLLNI
jgi:hypothetical protein